MNNKELLDDLDHHDLIRTPTIIFLERAASFCQLSIFSIALLYIMETNDIVEILEEVVLAGLATCSFIYIQLWKKAASWLEERDDPVNFNKMSLKIFKGISFLQAFFIIALSVVFFVSNPGTKFVELLTLILFFITGITQLIFNFSTKTNFTTRN